MFVNKEYLHDRWIGEIKDFSLDYFEKKFGNGISDAAIVTSPETDEFIFSVVKKLFLPMGSSTLIMKMALFCKCSFDDAEGIVGFSDGIPEATFCLHSLLMSAYPKDVHTGIFKATDGAIGPDEAEMRISGDKADHVAFSGLGVILMQKSREVLGEMLPDEDVVTKAHDHFLAIKE